MKLSKALAPGDRTGSSGCWAGKTLPMSFILWAFLQVPKWLDCKLSKGRDHVWSPLLSSYLGCNRITIRWMDDDYLLGDSSAWEAISHIHNWVVNHFFRTEYNNQTFQDILSGEHFTVTLFFASYLCWKEIQTACLVPHVSVCWMRILLLSRTVRLNLVTRCQ